MLLQSYDYAESGQAPPASTCRWAAPTSGRANIVNGIDLGRRMGTHQLYALTCPAADHLLGRQDGQDRRRRRNGSTPSSSHPGTTGSSGGNTEDADVARFLKLFTTLPLDEIARLAAAPGRGDQRGEEGARQRGDRPPSTVARRQTAAAGGPRGATFEEGALDQSLPTVEIPSAALAERARRARGLRARPCGARPRRWAEGRRQVKGGGLSRVNDAPVTDSERSRSRERTCAPRA